MELLRDDRRRRRRLGAPRDRRHARGTATRARTRSPRRASRSPPASSPGCSRRAGVDRVLTMDLHAGQIQGFFPKPVDHMTALLHAHAVLRRPAGLEDLVVVSPDAGRVKLAKKFAVEDRRRAGDPQQGAPGPAGRRDRLRDRRRQGQDRRDRRRHDRHRRHAQGRGADGARRGRDPRLRRRHARRCSPATRSRTSPPRRLRADRRHRHDPAARTARPTTSGCSRAPTCSPTRSAASSPTTR